MAGRRAPGIAAPLGAAPAPAPSCVAAASGSSTAAVVEPGDGGGGGGGAVPAPQEAEGSTWGEPLTPPWEEEPLAAADEGGRSPSP